MVRGIIFEIVTEDSLCNICSLSEEFAYDYCGREFEYCEAVNAKTEIDTLFQMLRQYGIETGYEDFPYMILTKEARESFFSSRFMHLQQHVKDMTLRQFAEDVSDLQQLIEDPCSDAVCLMGNFFWSFDEFIRIAAVDTKYYFGNTILMHL